MRPLLAVVISLASLVFPSFAAAEPSNGSVAKTRSEATGYSYEFTDDGLLGGGNSAYGLTIPAGRRVFKPLLIRPRTQFIAEMRKSVEVL